jgi:hypothetical protein
VLDIQADMLREVLNVAALVVALTGVVVCEPP